MQIQPIIAALKRHRTATALIVLQVALTLAITCNALFIAHQRIAHLSRPTGIDEPDIAVVRVQWTGDYSTGQLNAEMERDLAVLRQLPDVADAYADYSYPAAGPMAQLLEIGLNPGQAHPTSLAESYYADNHTISTLGLKLVAGRNFHTDEIVPLSVNDAMPSPPSIIITRALADALFPNGQALGHVVYIGKKPSIIIGIIRHLQVPALNTNSFAFRSVLLPYRLVNPDGTIYMVRARPNQLDSVIRNAPTVLLSADRLRVISANRYSNLRAAAYSKDRGMAILMCLICAILLAATAAGIVGLSSFWVEQRRKQIGIRRAIGATRGDILRYFQIENFLIVSFGIALGVVLTFFLNMVLMRQYELPHFPLIYLLIGAAMLWCLGQIAVLGPALRATKVPPVVATRTV